MNKAKNYPKLSLTLVLVSSLICWLSVANGHLPFGLQSVKADQAQSSKQRTKKGRASASSDKKLKQVPTQVRRENTTNKPAANKTSAQASTGTTGSGLEQSQALLDSKFDELIVKAKAQKTVRIIIGLRTTFQLEGRLQSAAAIQDQRAAIAQTQDSFLQRFTNYEATSLKRFATIPFLAMEISVSGLEQLRADKDVVSIQEDVAVPPSLAESTRLIGATAAWASGFSGAGQTVAILDTGVDKSHSFLTGKVVSEACYSTNSTSSNIRSLCPGGVSESTSSGSGISCPPNLPGCDHGTHVAGIAAGRGTNFSGVARDANLIAIQVFSRVDNNCGSRPAPCVTAFFSDIAKGLERVFELRTSYNIAAINMSIGGSRFTSTCDSDIPVVTTAINNLRSVGIATVVASGNESFTDALAAPACISSAISVGSTDDGSLGTVLDRVSSFSNSASFLSILAPGRWITSSVPENRFADFSGTSMAAPHVAGAWAVLKSRSPNASVEQILSALTSTGASIRDTRNNITKPRIRVDAALAALGGGNCIPTISPTNQTATANSGTGRVTVTINSGCSWQATSNVTWLAITAGASGNGNGVVDYSIAANPDAAARTGTLTIAGQTFTVRQDSGGGSDPCNTFTPINVGQELMGTLSSGDCQFSDGSSVDFYRFSGEAGQRIAVNLTSTEFDAYLVLFDANGNEIARDDDGGAGNDARIPAGNGFFTLPSSGNYFIAANSFSAGEAGSYQVRVIASTTVPSCTTITPITAGQPVNGQLQTTDCQLEDGSYADLYSFSGTAGQRISIALESEQFDAYLHLRDPGGTTIEQDDDGGGGLNARIPPGSGFLTLPVSGNYVIVANSLSANEMGNYILKLSSPTPPPNPVPTITSLEPNRAIMGGQGFMLIVNGTNFVNGSFVRWNGSDRGTTFISPTKVTAQIAMADVAKPGQAAVIVFNPAPGGGTSNTVNFTLDETLLELEADVAPRPNGNSNGTVTMADWVQLGRFFVGLDTPAPGSEFQRVDCAPKVTSGDGAISISDWVQAGRYAAGLDAVMPAGGPTTLASQPKPLFTSVSSAFNEAQPRVLRLKTTNFQRGQIGSLPIELDAQGNENAIAFSLDFDPKQMSFVDAAVGDGANGAALQISRSQAANGRVGFAVVLPPGQQLAAGTRTLLTLRFIPNGADGDVITNINFSDQLLAREIVDAFAAPLAQVSYAGSAITIRGRAAANVSAASYVEAELAADSIASAFGTSLATMTTGAVSLPLPNTLGGTSVKVKDALGVERNAPLFFVSPNQINYQIPAGTAEGIATVTITTGVGEMTIGLLNIGKVAPGIFAADASGQGWAAAEVVSVAGDGSQTLTQVARFDAGQNKFVAVPIDVQTNAAVLVLYGTGMRQRSDLANVKVKVGGVDAAVEYAGAQASYAGLDQVNVRLPQSLAGRGEVTVELMVEGKAANPVKIQIR